jgi:hypothetical protein
VSTRAQGHGPQVVARVRQLPEVKRKTSARVEPYRF